MAWAISHAESLLRNSDNSLPKFIRTAILESNSSAKNLMERFALNAVRLDDELHISLASIDALTGKKYALIDNIAVLRTHRGRGIASALIAHALHAYKADSLEFANLGVDTDNPTGAYRLYTKLGFELLRRSVIYEREV